MENCVSDENKFMFEYEWLSIYFMINEMYIKCGHGSIFLYVTFRNHFSSHGIWKKYHQISFWYMQKHTCRILNNLYIHTHVMYM